MYMSQDIGQMLNYSGDNAVKPFISFFRQKKKRKT